MPTISQGRLGLKKYLPYGDWIYLHEYIRLICVWAGLMLCTSSISIRLLPFRCQLKNKLPFIFFTDIRDDISTHFILYAYLFSPTTPIKWQFKIIQNALQYNNDHGRVTKFYFQRDLFNSFFLVPFYFNLNVIHSCFTCLCIILI